MTWTTPPTFVVGQLMTPTDLTTYLSTNPQYLYDAIPKRATMWHDEAVVLTGNALARTFDGNQFFNLYAAQSAAVNGDSFTNSFYLRAGTYTLNVMGRQDSASGIVDWYIDNSLVASGQDWYAAATTNNIVKTAASITVTGNGYHTLKGVVNGKNGSSSGFNIRLSNYWLSPAAD